MHRLSIILTLFASLSLNPGGGFVLGAQEISVRHGLESPRHLFDTDTVTICFMGDMMMHSAQLAKARCDDGSYDFGTYFKYIENIIGAADIAVANMEFTLAGEPFSGYPAFSAPDSYAEYLAGCGFDVFLCANNHIFDKHSRGAGRTLEIYGKLEREHGIRYTGLAADQEDMERNMPLILLSNGIRIGFINMTYGTNLGSDDIWPKTNYIGNTERLKQALEQAETEADLTIALPHWGNEYELLHSPGQEMTAEWLAECGADAIIGCHPHVIQDTASVAGVPVAYSLGNAVSNMSAADTQLELLLTMKVVRESDGDIHILPFELTYLWCSRPGGFNSSYTVIPVEEFIGSRDSWTGAWEYDKMIATYERVKKTHNK